ncbi:MAG: NfeD family protein [Chloroflexota bacterium]
MQIGDVIVDAWLIVLIVIGLVAFAAVTIIWGVRAHRFKIGAGAEELIGRTAEVKVELTPKGMVFIDDERWTAISESGQIEPGEEVVITRIDGLVLYVKKK